VRRRRRNALENGQPARRRAATFMGCSRVARLSPLEMHVLGRRSEGIPPFFHMPPLRGLFPFSLSLSFSSRENFQSESSIGPSRHRQIVAFDIDFVESAVFLRSRFGFLRAQRRPSELGKSARVSDRYIELNALEGTVRFAAAERNAPRPSRIGSNPRMLSALSPAPISSSFQFSIGLRREASQ